MLTGLLMVFAGAAGADRPDSSYVKLEIKGELHTGVVAIGGETTGYTVQAKDATVELEFGDNHKLRDLAEKLNGKTVLVAGTLRVKQGVEIRQRLIVRVASLRPAEKADE